MTPETARLLQHWRHHQFRIARPFFCQIEAVETAIWLTEVAPQREAAGARIWEHLRGANEEANPELMRIALKLATGAGKTTVMAMLIAWQTVNAVRHPAATVHPRLPRRHAGHHDQGSTARTAAERSGQLLSRAASWSPPTCSATSSAAKIVITNYHAFKRRERMELSKGGRALLQGRGAPLDTLETEGQMLQRVCAT